jgi:hypothetical protein
MDTQADIGFNALSFLGLFVWLVKDINGKWIEVFELV